MKQFLAMIHLLFASIAVGEVLPYVNARSVADVSSVDIKPAVENCSEVTKPVFYTIRYGDHLEAIVHRFGFRPLYGKRSQIIRISTLNKIKDPDVIVAGGEILLPFKCEEDASNFVLIDRLENRVIDSNIVKAETGAARLPSANQAQAENESPPTMAPNVLIAPASTTAAAAGASTAVSTAATPLAALPSATAAPHSVHELPRPFAPHSTLSFGGLYGFYRIDSKETFGSASALLLSRPSIGFELGWDLHWRQNLTTGFRLNGRSIEFQRATSGVLNNGKQTTSGAALDFKYRWTEKFKSSLGLNYDERLFVRSIQTGTAIIDVYHQPSFELIVEQELIRAGSLGLDFMAGYRQLLNASTEAVSINDSSEYLIGATFRQQLEKRQIELKINYATGQQKSSFSTQDNTGLEARIGIKMEIGK